MILSRLLTELILSMLDICYSPYEGLKSLQTQAYIHFVDFLDMCASMSTLENRRRGV